jgi:hypothetical protein
MTGSYFHATAPPPAAWATISGRPSPSRSPIAGVLSPETRCSPSMNWSAQVSPSSTRTTLLPPRLVTITIDGRINASSGSSLKSATSGLTRTSVPPGYGSPGGVSVHSHCTCTRKMPGSRWVSHSSVVPSSRYGTQIICCGSQ